MFFGGCGHLGPSLLLFVMLASWLWSFGAIIITGHASFVVMFVWCHLYCY
jgi:hypothetical protein